MLRVELNVWTKSDGEKQMELRFKSDDGVYSLLLGAWWCPVGGAWQTSMTLDAVEKLFDDVSNGTLAKLNQPQRKEPWL